MLHSILEDLEKMLKETTELKNKLNFHCESSWNSLCPLGNASNGIFRDDTPLPTTNYGESSQSAVTHSPLEDSFNKAADLIAYGQFIRNAKIYDSKICLKSSSDVHKELVQSSQISKAKIKPGDSSKPLSKDQDSTFGRQNTTSKHKSLHIKTIQTHGNQEKTGGNKQGKHRNIEIVTEQINEHKKKVHCHISQRKDERCDLNSTSLSSDIGGEINSTKYSHSCSKSLLQTVKTLRVPEDLRNLLKLYYSYENLKIKLSFKEGIEYMNDFSQGLNSIVKTRLDNDLKSNIKEKERYMKYFDVADGVCITQKNKIKLGGLNTILQYKSSEQLRLYEAKYHRLMELQLEARLIDVISTL